MPKAQALRRLPPPSSHRRSATHLKTRRSLRSRARLERARRLASRTASGTGPSRSGSRTSGFAAITRATTASRSPAQLRRRTSWRPRTSATPSASASQGRIPPARARRPPIAQQSSRRWERLRRTPHRRRSPDAHRTLTATNGSWSGTSPIAYAVQWQRCDPNGAACAAIAGATAHSYRLTSADVGHTIRAAVTATNQAGSTQGVSVPTAVIAAATLRRLRRRRGLRARSSSRMARRRFRSRASLCPRAS